MSEVFSIAGLAVAMPPLSPLTLQMRRVTGSVVGRSAELAAVRQELASAKRGQLAALTLEGEPGIGKSRLLVAIYELASAEGFLAVAVTADEELRGPFLLARAMLAAAARESPDAAQAQLQRALDAISGRDEPGLETLSADYKLLRAYDLAVVALGALTGHKPVALLIDDLQWADEDSVRMLRYMARADADLPIFVVLAMRPDELALVTEAANLIADMERMGMVRRLKLGRFTQMETTQFLKQVLAAEVDPSSAATMHAQAEGVPFIVEELARTYRDAGLVQRIDGVWMLAHNADRLVPSAVRTLIQRRAARLPEQTRAVLAEAAILGRNFSLKDLRSVRLLLAGDEAGSEATALAEALAPAVEAGLLLELPEGSVADYSFTHEQVKEFAADALTTARRRAIHAAIVDMLTAEGDPPAASLPLVAHHAVAARDAERAARFSVEAARAALAARAPDEVLRLVDLALPSTSAARDRVALLTARDEALNMVRRPSERLEGLAELGALAEALGDSHLELEIMLRRAAALRLSGEEERAVELSGEVRRLAEDREDRRAELAASLEVGQATLRSPLGESFSATASEVDLDGSEEAYRRACELAEELCDLPVLAAATRELGVIENSRARAWIVALIQRGEHVPIVRRIAAGETPDAVLTEYPVARFVQRAKAHYERALELFERLGDRRGVMSTIIAIAFINFGIDIHLQGSAKRIEEIRRLTTRMNSLTRESERARAEGQMLYGAHVFARAKVVPDLALSHGEQAYETARGLGDRLLEFASAGGVGLAYLDLGELGEAERWLDRGAAAAAAAPTPLRARQLELWRGIARAAAGDPAGMRQHLERAVRLATDQGRPAARCESLARLALEACRLGAERQDEELLSLAERSAQDAKALVPLLPGHPLWGAQADAALAGVALARGAGEEAAEAGRSAFSALQASGQEDLNLEIVLPSARAVLTAGSDEEKQMLKEELGMTLALVAQRILDEDVRVRWFRGPIGRELSKLAGPLRDAAAGGGRVGQVEEETVGGADAAVRGEPPASDAAGRVTELAEDETRLLWLLIEGRTNREIALELGVSEEIIARWLAEIYAKMGTSSRAEATAFAFNFNVV